MGRIFRQTKRCALTTTTTTTTDRWQLLAFDAGDGDADAFFITRRQQQHDNKNTNDAFRTHGGKLVGETWVQQSDAEDYIEEGQRAFQSEEYATAIALFEKALTSEGSGTKRDRTKPAELSLGEKQSAYYNLAASHGKIALGFGVCLFGADVSKRIRERTIVRV